MGDNELSDECSEALVPRRNKSQNKCDKQTAQNKTASLHRGLSFSLRELELEIDKWESSIESVR